MNIIERERGFSLLETMVALGLTSAIAVAAMQVFSNQSKGQKTIEANYEVTGIQQQILTILSAPDNCTRSFQGQLPEGGSATLIKKEVGATFEDVYKVDDQLPGNIRIRGYSLTRSFPNLATDEAILKINFSRGKAAIKDDIVKMIKIIYKLDISSRILSCFAYNNANDSFWVQSLSVPENIYYQVGNVGIGTNNPRSRLEVNGSIKLGSTTAACDTSREGEIKYNFTSHRVEVCNGTAWGGMGLQTCTVRTAEHDTGYHSTALANCQPDETLIGGSGGCESGGGANFTNKGFVDGNGWKVDCWHAMSPGYVTSKATAHAFCCK